MGSGFVQVAYVFAQCLRRLYEEAHRDIPPDFYPESEAEELITGLRAQRAQPLDAWHEDRGPVLWWCFPVQEDPWAGTPYDSDWPGYHTHWTPINVPEAP
jgi:hypothetical protein